MYLRNMSTWYVKFYNQMHNRHNSTSTYDRGILLITYYTSKWLILKVLKHSILNQSYPTPISFDIQPELYNKNLISFVHERRLKRQLQKKNKFVLAHPAPYSTTTRPGVVHVKKKSPLAYATNLL